MNLDDLAVGVAVGAHAGQTDKAGEPYIGHPLRVAAAFPRRTPEHVVALLHDVVEDTNVDLDILAGLFPLAIVEAVDAISKRRGEERDDYLKRVRANPLALQVKWADIADNADEERLALLPVETANRLRRKYEYARAYLTSPLRGEAGQ